MAHSSSVQFLADAGDADYTMLALGRNTSLRCALWLSLTFLFYFDVEWAFAIAVGVTVLDLIWAGVGFYLGYLGPAAAAFNAVLSGLILLFTLPAVISRSQARVRLRVELDRDAHGASEMYHRGLKYQRQGKWALAALHWRKAMVLNPKEPLFYKALGMAQARLGRYAKALATLEAGLHRAPQDGEFGKLIEAVKAMTADGRRSKCGVRTARGQTADG